MLKTRLPQSVPTMPTSLWWNHLSDHPLVQWGGNISLATVEAISHLPLHTDLFRHPPPRLNPVVPYGRRNLTTPLISTRVGELNGLLRMLRTARWWLTQQLVNLVSTCLAVSGAY